MVVPRRQRLVMVGNGMAGTRALEEILARAPQAFDISMFCAEQYGTYNRIMLSPLLAGEKRFADIVTHDRAWFAANRIEQISGEAVVAIDRRHRVVTGAHGTQRTYDVLLLATGSNPVMLPLPGATLPGVTGFRDVSDVHRMLDASRPGGRAVVIGGGLLGLEAAYGLSRNGMQVSVLHLMPTLMERQLDPLSAGLLATDLRSRGIDVMTGANTQAILGQDRVRAVLLADGRELPADLVVMAVGIRPNSALAKAAGLACGRGIQVDGSMRTSDPHIYAVGECVEFRGQVFGLVAPLYDMAGICADHITGVADSLYEPGIAGTRLKVTGIEMFSAGDFLGDTDTQAVIYRDIARGVHKRLVLRDDRLIGAVLYGDARDSAWYFDLIQRGAGIGAMRDMLIFGPAIASEPSEHGAAATMIDEAQDCAAAVA
ncbi:MAG TPA: FAD-dependent oxidoreductase [Acetobacteraceae bacterium]|nr:FAD-dependent oxidoreductase [Acetobacteraceae bacterium]